jgi:hypothetical protein
MHIDRHDFRAGTICPCIRVREEAAGEVIAHHGGAVFVADCTGDVDCGVLAKTPSGSGVLRGWRTAYNCNVFFFVSALGTHGEDVEKFGLHGGGVETVF